MRGTETPASSRDLPDRKTDQRLPVFGPRGAFGVAVNEERGRHRLFVQSRRRAEILAATRALLAENGVDKLRIRQLAALSGVTPPTVYHLVGSRDDVLLSAIVDALRAKTLLVDEQAAASGLHPAIAYVEVTLAAISNDPDYYRCAIEKIRGEQSRDNARWDINEHLRQAHARWLIEAGCDPEIRLGHAALSSLANVIVRGHSSAVSAWARGHVPLAELRRQMALGAAVPLMGISGIDERARILDWMRDFAGIA